LARDRAIQLISGSYSIQGWSSGTPTDSEDTLRFAELTGVRPVMESYPLEKAAEAYGRMISGKAKFRVVLKMGWNNEDLLAFPQRSFQIRARIPTP
jgi:D-arabinose 1-dehydrogenase-like Zn-dependent alcohol dehydrogenase